MQGIHHLRVFSARPAREARGNQIIGDNATLKAKAGDLISAFGPRTTVAELRKRLGRPVTQLARMSVAERAALIGAKAGFALSSAPAAVEAALAGAESARAPSKKGAAKKGTPFTSGKVTRTFSAEKHAVQELALSAQIQTELKAIALPDAKMEAAAFRVSGGALAGAPKDHHLESVGAGETGTLAPAEEQWLGVVRDVLKAAGVGSATAKLRPELDPKTETLQLRRISQRAAIGIFDPPASQSVNKPKTPPSKTHSAARPIIRAMLEGKRFHAYDAVWVSGVGERHGVIAADPASGELRLVVEAKPTV